jgi:SH3-like domain-containing protein
MIFNLIFLSSLSFFYVNEPVVDMRMSPTHNSKVVSQTVFAENVKIENIQDDWVQIVTPDNYSGWIEEKKPYTFK